MKTLLVSGASGIVGYGILKSLAMAGESYRLIGTSIYDDSVAPAFCDIFELAPRTTSSGYVDWLLAVIKKYNVDLLFPGIHDDMLAWNAIRRPLQEAGAQVVLNTEELIDLCADKWEFYKVLKQASPEYAIESKTSGTFAEFVSTYGLPFLLKPRSGFASKGIVIVDSERTFIEHKHELGRVTIAQPIVGTDDTEYTVSAFFDSNSQLCCSMGLKRKLSKEGYTDKAEVAMPKGTEEAIRAMATVLKPVGPTNFQFRIHNEQLKLLEVNPRISSATSIRAAFGYNESLMAVEYYTNGLLPIQPTIRQGRAVRYTEEYIFYDSDTV